jgi:hypothetical protein
MKTFAQHVDKPHAKPARISIWRPHSIQHAVREHPSLAATYG